jgi:iron complex transport system substrate-binding protein
MRLGKRIRFAALGIIAVLVLSACSTRANAGSDPQIDGPTRTIIDVEGTEVIVPEQPERVVVLSEPTMDGALALGVTPIGVVTGRGQQTVPNYLADVASDLPILGGIAQPNFEAIGAANPDLILVDGTSINNNPPVIAALRKIAPVVYTGYAGGDWRVNFRLIADALNLVDEGERIIAEYDAKVEAAKPLLTDYDDSTFSIVRWQGNGAGLILKELLPGRALTDHGLQRPPSQDREGRGHSDPVSLENLNTIDADYIFFGTLGGSSINNPNAGGATDIEGATKALAEAEAVPGFTQLGAYQNDRIILVDGSAWTSTGGPILMNRIVDDVLAALT